MQQDVNDPPVLSYGKARPSRRGLAVLLLLGGGVAYVVLWFALQFSRDVRWVDRTAWILEFPLIRLVRAVGPTLPNMTYLALAFVNGLCWSGMILLGVRFLWRRLGFAS